uniref:Uncharacterized protein n=1 Tax=Steinernema glaseri TaxID=37863 RepID=A0A1I7Y9H3_9BILA
MRRRMDDGNVVGIDPTATCNFPTERLRHGQQKALPDLSVAEHVDECVDEALIQAYEVEVLVVLRQVVVVDVHEQVRDDEAEEAAACGQT